MKYALCIKSKPAEVIFKIAANSLEEAKQKFIAMKQMSEEDFNKIFMVIKLKE